MQSPSRRHALRRIASAGSSLALPSLTRANQSPSRSDSVIAEENALPGTREWMLEKTRVDPVSKYRCPWIEGYASKTSVRAGEEIAFHVSTNPASSFTLSLYRLGYYQGHGGRLVKAFDPFQGTVQPDPPVGEKRVRACAWEACTTFIIPREWVSGVYVGKLTELREGTQSYLIFIVRDDREADFLFQCSDNTWQAYNRWPSQFSLYDNGVHQWYWGDGVQVSFRRPYGKYCQMVDAPLSIGSGEFFLWEFPFAYWLESQGYDVTYLSNLDTHADARGLRRGKGFLSVGHDEYWSLEMYRHVEAAREAGVSLGFFSGNAVCGRIRFSEQGDAFERVGVFGPPGGTREFEKMAALAHERPYAHELIGAHSTGPVTGGADWICTSPEHWIYAHTGMVAGDRIPGLIGWEYHGDPARIPGLEIVATGPTQSAPGTLNGGVYTATTYPGPRGNVVFNAATCWWADGLSAPPGYVRAQVYTEPQGPDRRVQQMTHNVLARMLG